MEEIFFFLGQKVLYFMHSTPRNKKSCFIQQITSEAIHHCILCIQHQETKRVASSSKSHLRQYIRYRNVCLVSYINVNLPNQRHPQMLQTKKNTLIVAILSLCPAKIQIQIFLQVPGTSFLIKRFGGGCPGCWGIVE